MKSVFDVAETIDIDKSDAYIRTYPNIVEYFAGKDVLGAEDLLRGALLVYGWMPTALRKIGPDEDVRRATKTLNRVRRTGVMSDDELRQVITLTNHSLVGASKLLHFLSPLHFAIWDSRIYTFLHGGKPHHYQLQNLSTYRQYHAILDELTASQRFASFHTQINAKIGYTVSPYRALEITMFHSVRNATS